jgi:hypothetical protein
VILRESDDFIYEQPQPLTVFCDDDPPPVTGVLLGPDEEVISVLREDRRPMGFGK